MLNNGTKSLQVDVKRTNGDQMFHIVCEVNSFRPAGARVELKSLRSLKDILDCDATRNQETQGFIHSERR